MSRMAVPMISDMRCKKTCRNICIGNVSAEYCRQRNKNGSRYYIDEKQNNPGKSNHEKKGMRMWQ